MKDRRFTPLHNEGKDAWALKIQEARFSDSGQYECQVSYHNDVEKKLKKQANKNKTTRNDLTASYSLLSEE